MKPNDSILMRIAPALLLALVLVPVTVLAQESVSQGRTIEFSSPGNAGTNLFNQFFPEGSDPASTMGDDKFLAPQAMFPVGRSSGVMLPPQRLQPSPAAQRKQLKALMEKQYWFLADTDEPLAGTTPEQIFNLPELDASGRQLETQSPVERYLANQAAKKQAANNAKLESQQHETVSGVNGILRSLDTSNSRFDGMDSTLAPGVPAALAPQSRNVYPNPGYLQNDYNPKPTAAATAQKARMEEFNKMIGMTETDNPHINPLTSSLNSSSPDSVGADWNPFLNSAKPASPKKSTLPVLNADVADKKPAAPVVIQPAKTSVEEQYQPLFAPAFSMPRRRVQ